MKSITPQQIEAEAERLAAMRMQVLEMHPFWGYLLLQVQLVAAPDLPALMATDCVRHIWYNPLMTIKLETAELGFALTHEVCHQVQETSARRCGREEFKWNMATDYAINALVADILTPGCRSWDPQPLYKMPKGGLFNDKYHDWIAETIYEDLCQKELKTGPVTVKVTLPNGEGGAMQLPGISNHGGGIDLHLPLDLDDDQREMLRERVMTAVENYQLNDSRGDCPLNSLRELGLLDPPKIPWRRLLHRYADMALAADDYSLAHPNKHYWPNDLVVPGRYNEQISSIVVALDTSGSMTKEALREVAKEIRGFMSEAQETTLIVADAAIQQVIPFEQLEDFMKTWDVRGGGGTNHVCVFEYIAEHKLNPALFIGLTDLYSDFPKQRPHFPVLWLTPPKHGIPPWGKVIEL